MFVPRIKVRQITPKAEENKFVRDAIDRGNMKVASIAKNIITAYGVEPNQVRGAAMAAFIERAHLVGELNDLSTQIKDLQEKLKVLKNYRKGQAYRRGTESTQRSRGKSTAKGSTAAILPNITKPANRFGALPVRQYSESRKT